MATKYRISAIGTPNKKLWDDGWRVSRFCKIFGVLILKYTKIERMVSDTYCIEVKAPDHQFTQNQVVYFNDNYQNVERTIRITTPEYRMVPSFKMPRRFTWWKFKVWFRSKFADTSWCDACDECEIKK